MPKVHLRGSLTFKFQFRRSLALRRSLGETRTTGGSNGSIARGLGTENTSFAIVWPMRMARIEHAWSTGFRRYIINARSAAGAGCDRRNTVLYSETGPVLDNADAKRQLAEYRRLKPITALAEHFRRPTLLAVRRQSRGSPPAVTSP
jgi:hypothetical protein